MVWAMSSALRARQHREQRREHLVHLCYHGDLSAARELVALGAADIDRQLRDGATALCNACYGGHAGVASMLLSARADVNQRGVYDGDEWSPLKMATAHDHELVVELLLRQDSIDVNAGLRDGIRPAPVMTHESCGRSRRSPASRVRGARIFLSVFFFSPTPRNLKV